MLLLDSTVTHLAKAARPVVVAAAQNGSTAARFDPLHTSTARLSHLDIAQCFSCWSPCEICTTVGKRNKKESWLRFPIMEA
jgi:hypothetical protein